MIVALYIAAAAIMAAGSLYFAWRNRDFRKFLAGAFFISSGILFYLYLAGVFGTFVRYGFCRNTEDQRSSLDRAFYPLSGLSLFWLRQEAKDVKRRLHRVRGPEVEAPLTVRRLKPAEGSACKRYWAIRAY
jgi:hypothetical protein